MRAAILRQYGRPPEPGDFDEPMAGDGEAVVEVLAAGINPVDIAIASGTFYGGAPPLPSVAGREGVGRVDGRRVYFDGPVAPFGSMAERAAIDSRSAIPLPDGVDDAIAVAIGIAGLAAWLSLEWRAQLAEGETVLVLGASGVVGQIGVQTARLLGAGRVVAAARSPEGLERARDLGADETVRLDETGKALTERFRAATDGGADVVLDPLWGDPAAAAVEAMKPGGRLVQLGQSAGERSSLLSSAIRGQMLSILGHTNFAAPGEVKRAAYTRMAEHAAAGELTLQTERVALDDVADAWRRQQEGPNHKLVVVP